jgi:hypothetical protein
MTTPFQGCLTSAATVQLICTDLGQQVGIEDLMVQPGLALGSNFDALLTTGKQMQAKSKTVPAGIKPWS